MSDNGRRVSGLVNLPRKLKNPDLVWMRFNEGASLPEGFDVAWSHRTKGYYWIDPADIEHGPFDDRFAARRDALASVERCLSCGWIGTERMKKSDGFSEGDSKCPECDGVEFEGG